MARQGKFQFPRIKENLLSLNSQVRSGLLSTALRWLRTRQSTCGGTNLSKNRAHPELLERLRKTVKSDHLIDGILVRGQHNLNYVCKEMAIGMLATCKQINGEATMLFWRENTFRFSSDFDWRGLRRFLISIGPEARSRIRSLEVSPPGWAEDQTCQNIDGQQYVEILH